MKKFRTVTLNIDINTTKDKVWDLIFNRFGEVNVFNPLIDGSVSTNEMQGAVGAERKCDLDAKNSVHEKIVAVRGNDGFDIDIIEGGLPMMDKMNGSFDLEATSANQTRVTLTMNFTTKPAFLAAIVKLMMPKMLNKMLVGLKYYLETDQLVTKGNIDNIMKGFKNIKKGEGFQTKELALA